MAGTFLHYFLTQKGKKVFVIDNDFDKNSSLVAAGMFNPIVFKRLNKSWNADLFVPAMNSFFQEMETFLDTKMKSEVDIVRIFSSMENQNDWEVKVRDENFKDYLSPETTNELSENDIDFPFGYGIVKNGGWVNTHTFLYGYRKYLTQENLILNEKFDYNSLKISDNNLEYKDLKAIKIIFCEGTLAMENPYFNYLPFKPTKGEVLTIEIKDFTFTKMANRGFFMLPLGDNKYRVGATYNWKDETYKTTEEGRNELIEKIKTVIKQDFTILDHQAGIRPTVKDRKPFIGFHPEHKSLAIFNGLGTKGILNGPYLAGQFCEVLEGNKILEREVDIIRYFKFYN